MKAISINIVVYQIAIAVQSLKPDIYWINLQQSVARRDYMISHLNSINATHYRINATTPERLTIPQKIIDKFRWTDCIVPRAKELRPNRSDIFLPYDPKKEIRIVILCGRRKNTLVEVALTVSHLIAIYSAITSPNTHPYALIAEDDIQISFDIDFNALVATAPKDFAILQLLTSNHEVIRSLWAKYVKEDVLWDKKKSRGLVYLDHWCTGAYLIKKSAMKKALKHIMYVRPDGVMEIKIIAGYSRPCFPAACCPGEQPRLMNIEIRDPPCIFSPRGISADDYIYAIAPTYTLTTPLITSAKSYGYASEIHSRDVRTYYRGFQAMDDIIALFKSHKHPLPHFAKEYVGNVFYDSWGENKYSTILLS